MSGFVRRCPGCLYDMIQSAKKKQGQPSWEQSREGFSYTQMEVIDVGYRKVGYLEQAWYIVKYKLAQLFRRR